ncbi:MAG: transcriptional repressor [Candidatus Accumulibacter sp.]|uniref:Fur family transcriptional regulator n=1 Tax=Accumulibacter sp. TaxID=2053492 RepID=UPI00287ADC34|nr:transcriptional repressor [Accumulibacter sp.]MDS4014422.1 transcriptional repressor [Accumulibacter sp.]
MGSGSSGGVTANQPVQEMAAARGDVPRVGSTQPDQRAVVGNPACGSASGLPYSPTSVAGPSSSQRIAARGGRVTRTRTAVLDMLRSASQPLAHDEVGAALAAAGIAHDRVTLYRTLDWLVTHGLAHRVAGSDRIWRFNAAVEEGRSHAHFQCARCGAVYCLENASPTLAAALPAGFHFQRAELTVYGFCPKC